MKRSSILRAVRIAAAALAKLATGAACLVVGVSCLALAQDTSQTGTGVPAMGVTTPKQNTLQIALLHWYNAGLTNTFTAGNQPNMMAFDGAAMWITNFGDNTVTKLRASDGALLGTFAVGGGPFSIAFDGANIWVANVNDNSVTKLRASDGAVLGVR